MSASLNNLPGMGATEPIVWTGDLEDDCTAYWKGLILRSERMDQRRWWWAVSVHDGGLNEIDSSNNYQAKCIGGTKARKLAEQAARKYIAEKLSG